jgi:two-component system chemotaxis response regulator CheB
MSVIKKAIIVDDSLLIRSIIGKILVELNYKVVSEASNGVDGLHKVQSYKPDLVIIDVMMPKMDGLTALAEIMNVIPTKTIVVSSYDEKYLDIAYKALDLGALAFIPKNVNLAIFEKELISEIKASEFAKIPKRKSFISDLSTISIPNDRKKFVNKSKHLVIIGASTGGPNLVHEIISKLRKPFPPVIIVQHLPVGFTESFATRMNTKTELDVIQGEDDMHLKANTVYIAPGGKHLVLKEGIIPKIKLSDGDRVNGVIPSLDPTIMSASHYFKDQLTVVILTGMGSDGLAGCRYARRNNCFIITQDEESCVIYGMPKAINEENLSDYTGNPNNIITLLNQRLSGS